MGTRLSVCLPVSTCKISQLEMVKIKSRCCAYVFHLASSHISRGSYQVRRLFITAPHGPTAGPLSTQPAPSSPAPRARAGGLVWVSAPSQAGAFYFSFLLTGETKWPQEGADVGGRPVRDSASPPRPQRSQSSSQLLGVWLLTMNEQPPE